jgi:3-O-methylgallate 3,4-dioxygenase
MAQIVLGIGSSHGPTIRTPPEGWSRLVQKDLEDPRFDYDALLKAASPALENEVTPEKMQARYNACRRAIDVLSGVLANVNPDAIVVISNHHGVPPPDRMEPVFGMFLSDTQSKIDRSGHQTGAHRVMGTRQPIERQVDAYAVCPGLADHLMDGLVAEGFDVACCFQSDPTAGIEDAFTFLYELYLPDRNTPIVPFLLSRYLPHQPTPRRCYAVGGAIRRAVEAWDRDMRVAIMASGGLSHQIVDEEQDRLVLRALQEKDIDTLCSLSRARLNRAPGTPETLNWVALAGAIEPMRMTLIDYVPCYRSKAGTGHGVTFAYWT